MSDTFMETPSATAVRNPWDRLAGETAKSYRAFSTYRDLPPGERSINRVAEVLRDKRQRKAVAKTAPRHYFRWSVDFRWVERAAEYDRSRDAERQTASIQAECDEIRTRLKDRGTELASKIRRANRALQRIDRLLALPGTETFVQGPGGPTVIKPLPVREFVETLKAAVLAERLLDSAHEQSVRLFKPEAVVLDADAAVPDTDALRAVEVANLERLRRSFEPAALAGDHEALAALLKIAERKSRLLGLDMVPNSNDGPFFPPPKYIEVRLPYEPSDDAEPAAISPPVQAYPLGHEPMTNDPL